MDEYYDEPDRYEDDLYDWECEQVFRDECLDREAERHEIALEAALLQMAHG